MGDTRFSRYYALLREAADPVALLRSLPDEGVIAALAAASREKEPYLANVLATEAMNRALRWGTLFGSLGDGVIVMDGDGRIIAMNPAAEKALGWTLDEVRGLLACVVLGVAGPDAPPGQALFLTGPREGHAVRAEEETFRRRDGAMLHVAYTSTPIHREEQIQGTVLVFRDVGARWLAEKTRGLQEQRRWEQEHALVRLSQGRALREGDLGEALAAITEAAAGVLRVARVGVWCYDKTHARLRSVDLYDADADAHSAGATLAAADFPAYFAALGAERTLAVHDARRDPRTSALAEPYLDPSGVTSMLDAPFRIAGRMEGVVCHEHRGLPRRWTPDEEAFAGAIADMVSVAYATHQRRQAEAALHREHARLQRVVEHAHLILFALDRDGVFTLSEGKGLEPLGIEPGQMVGRLIFEACRSSPTVTAHARRALDGESFTAIDKKQGRIYETRWTSLRDPEGRPDGAVAVARDVTVEVRARHALEGAERRFASLVDAVDGIVWEGEPATLRYTFVSRHAETILGYPPERWTEDPSFWRDHIHPEDRERVVRFCATKSAEGSPHVIEYRMLRADGRVVWLRDVVNVLAEGGRPVKSIGIMVDVTERKLAEAELAAHRDRLQEIVGARTRELTEANRELEAFAYSVSHDLRAHLRGITALSEALLEDEAPRLDEEGRRILQRLVDEAQRLRALVGRLLEFSRALSGGDVRRERIDLTAVAERVVAGLREQEPARKVDVSIEEGIEAWGDPALLRVVLENLLGNAWKYTARTPNARIELRTRRGSDGETVYEVRDNGAGFDMAQADRLFQPFQRLHAPSEFSGTGVGLATVRRIVARHGGRVWAEGRPGEGATFIFTLPAPSRRLPPAPVAL